MIPEGDNLDGCQDHPSATPRIRREAPPTKHRFCARSPRRFNPFSHQTYNRGFAPFRESHDNSGLMSVTGHNEQADLLFAEKKINFNDIIEGFGASGPACAGAGSFENSLHIVYYRLIPTTLRARDFPI